MATWKIGHATLQSGGRIEGSGEHAEELRCMLAETREVQVLPHPMPETPVEPGWVQWDGLLHVFAFQAGHTLRVAVVTDYEPDDEDLPPGLREQVQQQRRASLDSPYGRVH